MIVAWFVVAAMVGAVLRYHVGRRSPHWAGTSAINVVGAFLVGVVAAGWADSDALTLVGTGFCGSLTTYSMYALESSAGSVRHRVTVVGVTLTLGLGAVVAGLSIG